MEGKTMIPMLRTRTSNSPSLMDAFFGNDYLPNFWEYRKQGTMPAINIIENSDNYEIEVAAPGLEKKDFNVELDNNLLTVSSHKEWSNEEENEKYRTREFSYSSFKRSFSLPETIDGSKIKATYTNGILTLSIPKKEEAKEKPIRQISIS